jgi:hypothetical protein
MILYKPSLLASLFWLSGIRGGYTDICTWANRHQADLINILFFQNNVSSLKVAKIELKS